MLASPSVLPAGQRVLASAVAAAAAVLAISAVFFGGGFAPARLVWIGGGALLLAALASGGVLSGLLPQPRPDGPASVFAGCLFGLAVWAGSTTLWSVSPDRSWETTNRTLIYAAFALVGVVLGPLLARLAGAPAAALASSAAAVLGLVFGWALLAKCVPALYADYGRLARLRAPLAYWNELALLAAVAVPLALRLAAGRTNRPAVRAAGAVFLRRSGHGASELLPLRCGAGRSRRRGLGVARRGPGREPRGGRALGRRGRRRVRRRARAPRDHQRRAAAARARARRLGVRARRARGHRGGRRRQRRARSPRARAAAGRARAPQGGASCRRARGRARVRRAGGRARVRPPHLERLHQPGDEPDLLEPRTARERQLEQPLALVAGGLACLDAPPVRRHRGRHVRAHRRAAASQPARDDRAAQRAAAVPERDRDRRLPALPRRRRGRGGRARPRPRAGGGPGARRGDRARALRRRVRPAPRGRLRLELRRHLRAAAARRRSATRPRRLAGRRRRPGATPAARSRRRAARARRHLLAGGALARPARARDGDHCRGLEARALVRPALHRGAHRLGRLRGRDRQGRARRSALSPGGRPRAAQLGDLVRARRVLRRARRVARRLHGVEQRLHVRPLRARGTAVRPARPGPPAGVRILAA